MNNEHEKTPLVGITLDLALVALYGPDAPQKVRVAYDMVLARETIRYDAGFTDGKQQAEADAKKQIDDLVQQRDAWKDKYRLQQAHLEETHKAANLPWATLQSVVPDPVRWQPGLPPMQQQPRHGTLNVDQNELHRMYNNMGGDPAINIG